jgi:hypothetical protein
MWLLHNPLAEVHSRAAVRDDLATDTVVATDAMAVFGAHPEKRSRERAEGLCDNHPCFRHSRRRDPFGHARVAQIRPPTRGRRRSVQLCSSSVSSIVRS